MANPIQIRNNFFYLADQRWSPKGICYQPQDGVDPLSDDKLSVIQGLVDGNWKKLGINAVRVYQVDPSLPHDQVMSLLAAHHIYVEVGAVNGQTAIDASNPQYTSTFLNRIKSVADAFAQYDNVLYLSIANEAITPGLSPGYAIPSIIKAGARDLRTYMAQKGYRAIPIGCAERDDPQYTIPAAAAYMCGAPNERLDVLGYNCYRWAGGSLQNRLDAYYHLCQVNFLFNGGVPIIPVIMTEYGANTVEPRPFDDVPYLFGSQPIVSNGNSINMADVFSGGFVFRYQEDGAHFGLVDAADQPTSFGGFTNLQKAYQASTGFSSGIPNPSGILDCGTLGTNPYNLPLPPPPASGGIPNELSVTATNEIDPVTSIRLNCLVEGIWTSVLTMTGGQPQSGAKIPASTTQVQVVFQSTDDGKWYQACGVAQLSELQNGTTIRGTWQPPDGQGTCLLSWYPARQAANILTMRSSGAE